MQNARFRRYVGNGSNSWSINHPHRMENDEILVDMTATKVRMSIPGAVQLMEDLLVCHSDRALLDDKQGRPGFQDKYILVSVQL